MPLLEEVPDALERPSGCRIRVWQSEDKRETTVLIPPREVPVWMFLALGVLCVNLLLVLVTGVVLLFWHRSILFMTQIAPGDVPLTMRRFTPWYAFGWSALLTVGVWLLASLIRPLVERETLTISPRGITRERRFWRHCDRMTIPHSDLRGFRLERDPQRLIPSVLSVRGRSERWTIAESLGEADREWLASVGAALLRGR